MANMTFKANLLPNTDLGQALGSSTQRWVINGVINGSKVFYGTCPTAADTGEKAVVCPEFTATDLAAGTILYVTFANVNSVTPAGLTLNVNSTGARPLKYMYNNAVNNIPGAGYLLNQTYMLHYDGTNWVIDTMHYNTNTTYSVREAVQNGTSASLVTTGEKYNWNNMGTVHSVQVGATSPVVSSNSTTATDNFTTTISLADNYGDTKNPYAAKPTGYVLAGPVYNPNENEPANVAPTFRALTPTDIPILNIDSATTGVLPISRGGTGADTAATAWTNLGGGDIGKLNKGNASATATFLAQNGTWLTPPGTYVLPKATSAILGGITVGSGLDINDGNLSVNWANAPVASVNGATGTVVLSDLVIGTSRYNGSTTVTIAITDLGLTAPMTFKGVTDTTLIDGTDVSPVNITSGGTIGSLTPTSGDVVLQKDEQIEYLYTGSAWTQLGIASSYSLSEHAHGYILNDGIMATTVTVATGDHLIIADASDYNRIVSGDALTFDTTHPEAALSRAGTWVDYLQLTGGTMTGAIKTHGIVGTLDYDYGEVLPTTAVEGQVFFQVSYGDEVEFKIPAGGTAGYALVKNSNADGDLKWQLIQANDKVAKAGDTMSGRLNNTLVAGGTWIKGTHEGSIYVKNATTASSGSYYQSWYSGKTPSGAWGIGCLSGNEDIYFVYGSDANYNNSTNTTGSAHISSTGQVWGAVWNDYAEFRKDNPEEVGLQMPGICVHEVGNGQLERTMKRLERGCEIISDTFGFAIGHDKEHGYNTPIASSGRVLAYIYEGRETARNHIGWPVCSGPNGTVSIMTEEEELKYPSRIIGTISEIPDYDVWGSGDIQVNGRIWIRIR